MILHGWHSPRFFRELASALEANPEQTIAKYQGDPFVRLLVVRMMRDVDDILAVRPFLAAQDDISGGATKGVYPVGSVGEQEAKELSQQRPHLSLREISAELERLGKATPNGKACGAISWPGLP